ncbi:MAG: hypothetical protein FJX66_11360 [Alphaproteobacteria bacterium]|nr:hypothetical protein [Alphaproteobacteria bacterium]
MNTPITQEQRQREIDANFEAFQDLLPKILDHERGRFAVMRDRKIIEVFDTAGDALRAAAMKFEDGRYSIQEITDRVIGLGYYSYAVPSR